MTMRRGRGQGLRSWSVRTPLRCVLPVAVLLSLGSGAPGVRAQDVLRVGEGEAFGTVAEAVDAAAAGDTVRVAAGIHVGRVVVDRPLVLLGEPGAVLDGGGRGTVVTVRADSVEIRGFRVRGGGRSLDEDEASIRLVRCRGCRVLDNRLERALHGIYLEESTGTEIGENVIEGDSELPEARRGNGIHLYHSPSNLLRENRIREARDGIYFSFASGNRVVGNEVTDVRYGLHYMYSDDNLFLHNRFRRNAAGAALMFSKRITFRRNVFAEHVGHRAYGILLQTTERITAERNRFEGNLVGIFMDNATGGVFRENLVADNGVGIQMLSSAENNLFVGNAFVRNRTSALQAQGHAVNRWSEGGRGNYWADPGVFDLDGDGVGDRPHRAGDPFASLALERPALEAFNGTLAARALAWAESAFPVFGFPAVEDPHPLVAPPEGIPEPGDTP